MNRKTHRSFGIVVLALAASAALAGSAANMLVSNRDRSLAINAWGGLRDGAPLRLHNACRPDNPDCNWNYRGGQIFSTQKDGVPYFIKATDLRHGAELVVARDCPRDARGCGWVYRDGLFVSDKDASLAIVAWDGARFGTTLRLSKSCTPSNRDCTWSR